MTTCFTKDAFGGDQLCLKRSGHSRLLRREDSLMGYGKRGALRTKGDKDIQVTIMLASC